MDVMIHSSSFLLPELPADQTSGAGPTYALVLLNQHLPRFTPLLWKHAQLRVCADGGANRLYDELPGLFPDEDASSVRNRYKPDVIKGDMDSIRAEVLEFYKNMGTKIVDASHDQDTTDLHKCVAFVRDFYADTKTSTLCILVVGALGGRFDHEMGNINVLCRFSTIRIVLVSEDCLIELLPSTCHHEIHIQSSIEGPHCGLIPIGTHSGSTTTTGLQWNLTNTEMRFGGLISTSNIVRGETVTVQSSSDLLWTLSVQFRALENMLPLSLLKTAQGHPMLVELKNGETYNGHLVNCDTWMNIHLREVICTSKDGDKFWRMPECYIRGNTIKYLRVPDEVIDKVQEEKSRADRKPPGAGGRGRGRGREDGTGGRGAKGMGRGMDDGLARGSSGGRGRGGPGGRTGGSRGGGRGR
ncbi:hypothetical protein ACET3Z_002575 [Daucus carota]